jgi:filamentous hemagglutinin family protein
MLINARAIRGFSRLLNGTALSVAAGVVVLAAASPAYAVGLNETPTGGVVAAGAATIDVPVAGTLNVTQSTDRAVIHWDTMNLGHDATWSVAQPGAGSLNINVATGAGTDPSEILGALDSNGRVILLDRNGVIFGADSQVDVAGLVASSGSLDETEAMASGKLILSGDDLDGAVINRGTMTVAEGGLAALVAPRVKNSGVINAKLGRVVLASGKKATIDLAGDGLFELAVDEKLEKAVIENTNSGKIFAEGGSVLVTTATAVSAVDNVINMKGVVDVSSVSVQGGKIILNGGDTTRVRVGGTLKSDGGTGGDVEVKGRSVRIQGDGKIMTGGGDITLHAERRVRITNGFADAEGGNVRVETGNGFEGIGSSLLTTGTGTIYIQQSRPDLNTIQNAIDAISNSGVGTNTIDVAGGTWIENLYIGAHNLILNGAKVGVAGDDDSRDGTGETVVEAADNALDTITVIADNVVIDGLTVTGGNDGIRGILSPNLRVQNNIVHDTAGSGIDLTGSPDSVVAHNLVFNNGWDGIKADGESNGISILFNKVENVARAGVSLIETASALVQGNDLSDLGMWGVYARESDDLKVISNTIQGVSYSEEDSKTGHGIYHVDSNNSHIARNTISEVAVDGIHVANFFGDDGIYVGFNNVSYAKNGLFVSGPSNGKVMVEGNIFSDNDIGAHFQSGLIDLTGAGNRFNRGRVGLRFAPMEMYYPTFYEVEPLAPLSPVYSYLELVDDDAPGVSPASQNPPTNFGGTIGAQIFDGQSEYFVELDNGAFFEPGTPTWLNGLNSSYRMPGGEFLTPAASGGLLSAFDLAYLEAGFYHYIDDSSLGRFWFGQLKPDDTAGVPPEDVFNTFGRFGGRAGNVVVTLLGLPRLPGQGGGGAGGGAGGAGGGNITDFLNSITPAAGDEEGQSGEGAPTPEQLAAIETAAGGAGQSANCWSDATANAQNGGPTTISFSPSVGEEALQQEAACGNNPQ